MALHHQTLKTGTIQTVSNEKRAEALYLSNLAATVK